MATFSFDFDGCLWDEGAQSFIPDTVALLKSHLRAGDRVIVVTSRVDIWANEARILIQNRLGLNIEVFSAPGFVGGPDPVKSDILIRESAVQHLDDIPDDDSLDAARLAGVVVKLPPATSVHIPRMY